MFLAHCYLLTSKQKTVKPWFTSQSYMTNITISDSISLWPEQQYCKKDNAVMIQPSTQRQKHTGLCLLEYFSISLQAWLFYLKWVLLDFPKEVLDDFAALVTVPSMITKQKRETTCHTHKQKSSPPENNPRCIDQLCMVQNVSVKDVRTELEYI